MLGDDEREQTVAARLERQRLLTRRNPPRIEVILGESALVRPVADGVMVEQLDQLDRLTRLPNVTLRILPLREPHHCALLAGARFYILDFPPVRNPEPTTVYVENLTGALYLDKPAEVRAYDAVWRSLPTLPPAESRAKINEHKERCSS